MFRDIVGPALGMQDRIAARIDRLHHVGNGGERLIFDTDETGGVFGDVAAVGDNQCDRLAKVADFAQRQAALLHRRVGKAGQRLGFLRRLRAGDDANDTRQRARRAGVDRFDARVRVRAAQRRSVRHVRQLEVIDEMAAADQEARVLFAQHARADDVEPLIGPLLLPAGRRREDFACLGHQRLAGSARINSTARSTELTMSS